MATGSTAVVAQERALTLLDLLGNLEMFFSAKHGY